MYLMKYISYGKMLSGWGPFTYRAGEGSALMKSSFPNYTLSGRWAKTPLLGFGEKWNRKYA